MIVLVVAALAIGADSRRCRRDRAGASTTAIGTGVAIPRWSNAWRVAGRWHPVIASQAIRPMQSGRRALNGTDRLAAANIGRCTIEEIRVEDRRQGAYAEKIAPEQGDLRREADFYGISCIFCRSTVTGLPWTMICC